MAEADPYPDPGNTWRADWDIIWRSELRALAEDRELREAFAVLASGPDAPGDTEAGRAWAASPAWPTAAVVPPDGGRPAARVDGLERRGALPDPAEP